MLERKLELLSKAVGALTFAVSSEKVAVKLIVSNAGWRRAQHTVGFLANGPVQWDGWRLSQGLESFHFFVSLILVTESPFSCTTQTRAGGGGWRGEKAVAKIASSSELLDPKNKKKISTSNSVIQCLYPFCYTHLTGNGSSGTPLKGNCFIAIRYFTLTLDKQGAQHLKTSFAFSLCFFLSFSL